jgi:hypothetical protein
MVQLVQNQGVTHAVAFGAPFGSWCAASLDMKKRRCRRQEMHKKVANQGLGGDFWHGMACAFANVI